MSCLTGVQASCERPDLRDGGAGEYLSRKIEIDAKAGSEKDGPGRRFLAAKGVCGGMSDQWLVAG